MLLPFYYLKYNLINCFVLIDFTESLFVKWFLSVWKWGLPDPSDLELLVLLLLTSREYVTRANMLGVYRALCMCIPPTELHPLPRVLIKLWCLAFFPTVICEMLFILYRLLFSCWDKAPWPKPDKERFFVSCVCLFCFVFCHLAREFSSGLA